MDNLKNSIYLLKTAERTRVVEIVYKFRYSGVSFMRLRDLTTKEEFWHQGSIERLEPIKNLKLVKTLYG